MRTRAKLLAGRFARLLDGINERVGRAVAWLCVALTLLTAYDVLARYAFKSGSVALQELEWHLFSVIFLLGAGYTLKYDAHVRVDIFYAKAGERARAAIDLFGALFLLLPFCALIIWTSWGFVANSFSIREASGDPGGLPARYALKAMIIAGFSLVAAAGAAQALRSALRLLDGERRV